MFRIWLEREIQNSAVGWQKSSLCLNNKHLLYLVIEIPAWLYYATLTEHYICFDILLITWINSLASRVNLCIHSPPTYWSTLRSSTYMREKAFSAVGAPAPISRTMSILCCWQGSIWASKRRFCNGAFDDSTSMTTHKSSYIPLYGGWLVPKWSRRPQTCSRSQL